MIRQWAVVLAVGAVLAVGGCATPASSQAVSDEARVELGRQRLIELATAVHGSYEQNRALQQRMYAALQGPLRACMAWHGYRYPGPPFGYGMPGQRPEEPGWFDAVAPLPAVGVGQRGFGLADQAAYEARVALAEGKTSPTDADPNPGFEALPEAERPAYLAQLEACEPPPDSYQDLWQGPPSARALEDALNALVTAYVESAPVRAIVDRYPSCLSSERVDGLQVGKAEDLQGIRTQVSNRYVDVLVSDGLTAPLDRTTGWLQALDFEQRVAAADRTCREPAFRLVMSMLADPLQDFADTREGDLATAAADFAELVAQAERDWRAFEAAGHALVVTARP